MEKWLVIRGDQPIRWYAVDNRHDIIIDFKNRDDIHKK